MKKLILLAVLFGLTGCGDNNQSDTTQTNTQASTLQKDEVAPAVASYSLAASPRAMSAVAPLQGWSITQSFVEGASTLINAIKDTKVSGALVTPNAKQVAEVLRGGAAGIALSVAVDQLLGAVDWVLDPVNNQITYKPKTDESVEVDDPRFEWLYSCGDNYQYICQYRYFTNPKAVAKFILPSNPTTSCWDKNPISGCVLADGFIIYANGRKNEKYKPQNLSLEVIAEKVISNADDGSLDAQVATNAAAQNILNDEELAKPVVQELENNAKNNCPSGIIKNGSCWVCEKELYYPMSRATRDAKTATRGKSCKDVTDTTIKAANATLFRNLINARIQENACWSPPDPNHATALVDAQNALRLCEN
ncbi:hypothetical protein [Acinetobacter proteolyticus]|uniref:hypothetical protein n=1 Tax=Acinetobacter proteolyticus TaxID=1776741 RepID=UPI003D97571D